MKTKFISFIFGLVLMLSACSGGSALQQNRQKWEAQNIDHYRFSVVVSCFCPFAGAEVTFEVRNGEVVSQAVKASQDWQIDEAQLTEFYQPYNTIEKVFAYVEGADKEADETTVTFDPTFGFPTDVSVDWIKLAIDDEMYLTLSNFDPLG